jgi:hypothetical protein
VAVSVTGADAATVAVVSLLVVFTFSVFLQPTVARSRSEAHKLMIVFNRNSPRIAALAPPRLLLTSGKIWTGDPSHRFVRRSRSTPTAS